MSEDETPQAVKQTVFVIIITVTNIALIGGVFWRGG